MTEGKAAFAVPSVDKSCFTWYKTWGDLNSAAPLIIVHGGPAAGHDLYLPFIDLWSRYKIPVVLYDQIGCGSSTRLPETGGDHTFWTVSIFIAELNNLIDHLGIRSGYHVLGHSFGGYIVPLFAADRPQGLRRLVIASGSASKALSYASFDEIRAVLPPEHQEAIAKAGELGKFDSVPYKQAMAYFSANFLCRADPPPPELLAAGKNMYSDPTVISTMSGPSPFFKGGSMAEFTSVPRLHEIEAPTLIYNAEYDTNGRDVAQLPFFYRIPKVRWVTFQNAGHLFHVESVELREKVLKLIAEFLVGEAS